MIKNIWKNTLFERWFPTKWHYRWFPYKSNYRRDCPADVNKNSHSKLKTLLKNILNFLPHINNIYTKLYSLNSSSQSHGSSFFPNIFIYFPWQFSECSFTLWIYYTSYHCMYTIHTSKYWESFQFIRESIFNFSSDLNSWIDCIGKISNS